MAALQHYQPLPSRLISSLMLREKAVNATAKVVTVCEHELSEAYLQTRWLEACMLLRARSLFRLAEEMGLLKSLKKAKAVEYEGQMLLMPMCKDTEIKLVNPDYDPFAAPA